MALSDRIRMLERRAAGGGMLVIVVTGGLPDGEEPKTAEAGSRSSTQESGESWEAFQARVIAEARAAGAGGVVIGGLPS